MFESLHSKQNNKAIRTQWKGLRSVQEYKRKTILMRENNKINGIKKTKGNDWN